MAWHYRSPLAFPALLITSLRSASLSPDIPIPVQSGTEKELLRLAEQFRWLKWCLRQKPEVSSDLFFIVDNCDVRTQIKEDGMGFILFLVVRPTKVSEFARLNPELAAEIFPDCQ